MFARITRYVGLTPQRSRPMAQDIDRRQLPYLEQEPGFAGAVALVDHLGGALITIALWESEASMEASEVAAGEVRESIQAGLAYPERPIVARCEVVAVRPWTFHSNRRPYARLTRHPGLVPDRVAERVEHIEREALPVSEAERGFAGALVMANHRDAQVFYLTLWSSEGAMEASEPAARGVRESIQAGLSVWDRPAVSRCEVVTSRPLRRGAAPAAAAGR